MTSFPAGTYQAYVSLIVGSAPEGGEAVLTTGIQIITGPYSFRAV